MRRSRRLDPLRIRDIVESIGRIERWSKERNTSPPSSFAAEPGDMYRSAVLRELTVIAEAALALSDRFVAEHPDLPWSEIRGFRNRVVHEYWDTDWAIIEQMIARDLPALQCAVALFVEPPSAPDVPELLRAASQRPEWSSPVARPTTAGDVATCGAWMPIARARCALPPGHAGHHRSSP